MTFLHFCTSLLVWAAGKLVENLTSHGMAINYSSEGRQQTTVGVLRRLCSPFIAVWTY
jgi:hypothetical protein